VGRVDGGCGNIREVEWVCLDFAIRFKLFGFCTMKNFKF
jgi:hypothetical protein